MGASAGKRPSEKMRTIVSDRPIGCHSIDAELRAVSEKMGATFSDPCVYCHSIDTELAAIYSMHELGLVCHACGLGFQLERTEEGEWVTRR